MVFFFLDSHIVTEKSSPRESNGTSLQVCELIGMLANVVNGHVQKRQQKRITKKKR